MSVPGVKKPYSPQSIQYAQRCFQAAVHPHVKIRAGIIYALQAQESLTLRLFCEFPWWRKPDTISREEAKQKCDELTETGVGQFFSYIQSCRQEVLLVMKYICACAQIAVACVPEPENTRYANILVAATRIPVLDDIYVNENIVELAKLIGQSGISLVQLDSIICSEARGLSEVRSWKRFQKEHNEDIGWSMFDALPFTQDPETYVPLDRACEAVAPDAPLLPYLTALQTLFELELKLLVRQEVLRKWPLLRPINYAEGETQRKVLLDKCAKARQEMYPTDFPVPPMSQLLRSGHRVEGSADLPAGEASDASESKDASSGMSATRQKKARDTQSALVNREARRSKRQRTPSSKYAERFQSNTKHP